MRLLTLLALLLTNAAAFAGDRLTVSAAASMKESLSDITIKFQHDTGIGVDLNLGASGQLAAQIDAGAPVDVLVSAGEAPIKQLEITGKISASRIIAGNRIVLIVPADRKTISDFRSLATDSIARIVIGRPKVVPAGDYAMQVLDYLKLTSAIKTKLVYGQNVRQVLDYVARGEVDAGIVYTTDAAEAGNSVRVAAIADESSHDPVRYLAAVVKGSNESSAEKFAEYLTQPTAQSALRAHGFLSISASPPGEK